MAKDKDQLKAKRIEAFQRMLAIYGPVCQEANLFDVLDRPWSREHLCKDGELDICAKPRCLSHGARFPVSEIELQVSPAESDNLKLAVGQCPVCHWIYYEERK